MFPSPYHNKQRKSDRSSRPKNLLGSFTTTFCGQLCCLDRRISGETRSHKHSRIVFLRNLFHVWFAFFMGKNRSKGKWKRFIRNAFFGAPSVDCLTYLCWDSFRLFCRKTTDAKSPKITPRVVAVFLSDFSLVNARRKLKRLNKNQNPFKSL